MSKVDVVMGSQWGDEGKGKLVDTIGDRYDLCCRATGGANAGHTIIIDGKPVAFHLVPIGIVQPNAKCIIGNGCVVNVFTLFEEMDALKKNTITADNRLFVSDRAHIVFNFHQICDGINELNSGDMKIGTTKRGIGPTYASKMERYGVRMGSLRNWEHFKEQYMRIYNIYRIRYNLTDYDYEDELNRIHALLPELLPMIVDSVYEINQALKEGKKVLVEGANAPMLDVDFGTYPFVTSSSASIGGICTGLGVSPHKIGTVYGIVKAYTTRVGEGPFPTEQLNEVGEKLRSVGHEYGATTGRPRRCGWLDLVEVGYTNLIDSFDSLCLTKLDVMTGFETIKVARKYLLDGAELKSMPAEYRDLERVEVVYDELPGWSEDISKVRKFEELPENAQKYVEYIEKVLGVPINFIGVGADRDSVISH
ncbi:hypothetical protein WA577_004392 [Blastocystis sp. JDR]